MPDRYPTLELEESERALPAERKLEEAQKAYEEALLHKAAHKQHQRLQRRAMQRFDLFRADLEAMGIQVIIEPATHPVRYPQSHTSQRRSSDNRSSV